MSDLKYTLADLNNLVNRGIRDNMLTSRLKSKWFPEATQNCFDSVVKNGNPIHNSFYKNMNMDTLKNHVNIASYVKPRREWNTEHEDHYDCLFDEGKVSDKNFSKWRSSVNILYPYKKYINYNNYQPYFEPKNRLSDLCTMNSSGPVGLKFLSKAKEHFSACYSDSYKDNDLSCITAIIDFGKGSSVVLDESFENKLNSCKLYNIVYLIREGADVHIDRRYDLLNKDTGINVVESRVIQFPNSRFTLNVVGEGSKHTQDIVDVEVYNDCFTSILGSFNCFDNVTNNMVVDMHHKGPNSFSRVDVKSIVDDSAHSSFLGKITVDKEAEGVDAELFNKNLLLSNKATAITEPQLDINTKEINCKHGCTVSNINKEDLYYLESRGIETTWAEETLKKCFLTI